MGVYVKTMCSYRIGVIIKVSIIPKSVEDHTQKLVVNGRLFSKCQCNFKKLLNLQPYFLSMAEN